LSLYRPLPDDSPLWLLSRELYYIACARHLDFGTSIRTAECILAANRTDFVRELLVRVADFSCAGSALTIVLTGFLHGRWRPCVAIALACTSMLGSLFFLAVRNFIRPMFMSPLFWTARFTCSAELYGAQSRTWALVWGVVASESKTALHGFFRRGNRACDFVNAAAPSIAQKWIWLGVSLPCHRASEHHLANRPWLAHLGVLHGIAKSNKTSFSARGNFSFQQITLTNPATFPLWFGGLIWLLVSHEGRRYRVIAFTYLIAFTEFVVMHGKNYYLAPAYPMLFAAGGVAFERIFALRMRWLKPAIAFSRRRVSGRLRNRSSFPSCPRRNCSPICARFISRPHERKRRILRH